MGLILLGQSLAPASAGCAESTAFLARTSGLDATHILAYDNFICGLVTDGVWSRLDLLYVMATQDSTTAGLNLKSSSFTLSPVGSPTFTADQGYTGGTGKALDTTWVQSTDAINYTLNDSCFGLRDNTSRSQNVTSPIGADTTDHHFFNWCNVAASFLTRHNGGGAPAINGNSGSKGLYASNRTSSNDIEGFQDGASIGAATQGVNALATNSMLILAANVGAGVPGNECSDQISMAFAGASLNATLQAALSTRFATYRAAIGLS